MNREKEIRDHLNKAWHLRGKGDYPESKRMLENALKLCRESDYLFLGRIQHIYMQYEADHNNFKEAIIHCNRALSLYKMAKAPNRIAHSMRHLADLYMELDQPGRAGHAYEEALRIYREDNDSGPGDLANALRGYGNYLEQQSRLNDSLKVWKEVLDIWETQSFHIGIIEARDKIAMIRSKQDKQEGI